MTDTAESTATLPDIEGGPYDIEFFFDPGCPFAWQTSVWTRRIIELRGIKVGWRFISLKFINESNSDTPDTMKHAQQRGLEFHRICAAARERFGNDAVAKLYEAYGNQFWNTTSDKDMWDRFGDAADNTDPAAIIESVGLPADLLDAKDDVSYDVVIRAESDAAFARTGPDVGTPIITFDPPHGNSLFGPVISSVPDDERSLAFYDALRTFADFEGFSELKRTKRAPLDLALFSE